MDFAAKEGIKPADGYAGDIAPAIAWQWASQGDAVIVDVRTEAERVWVGRVPGAIAVAWKEWPGMAENPGFEKALAAAFPSPYAAAPAKKLLMLCRSGVRSVAAARKAAAMGFQAYNILEGFEGEPDAKGQRGHLGGWRKQGLPWQQG